MPLNALGEALISRSLEPGMNEEPAISNCSLSRVSILSVSVE